MRLLKMIHTKYIGPTNTKGSRCKAYDDAGNKVIISWASELDVEKNHRKAALALLAKIETKYTVDLRSESQMTITSIGSWDKGYMFGCERKMFTKGGVK